jgi:hypothetical protein
MTDLALRRKELEDRLKALDSRLHEIEEELDSHQSKDWEELATEREGDEVLERLGVSGQEEIVRIRAALSGWTRANTGSAPNAAPRFPRRGSTCCPGPRFADLRHLNTGSDPRMEDTTMGVRLSDMEMQRRIAALLRTPDAGRAVAGHLEDQTEDWAHRAAISDLRASGWMPAVPDAQDRSAPRRITEKLH